MNAPTRAFLAICLARAWLLSWLWNQVPNGRDERPQDLEDGEHSARGCLVSRVGGCDSCQQVEVSARPSKGDRGGVPPGGVDGRHLCLPGRSRWIGRRHPIECLRGNVAAFGSDLQEGRLSHRIRCTARTASPTRATRSPIAPK